MDTITAARQLGKAIQEDDRYVAYMLTQEKSNEDEALQSMISQFNMHRNALMQEAQKPDRDQEKVQRMDGELKNMYAQIFQNPNMVAFNEARDEMQKMIDFVNQIISGSASGQNPDTIEYQEGCEGDCGGCAGCS